MTSPSSARKARLKPASIQEKKSQTPRLKAGAKKSPLKRAGKIGSGMKHRFRQETLVQAGGNG
jgi:hypothetical protein